MTPSPAAESENLEHGIVLLRRSLPPGWRVDREAPDRSEDSLADVILDISSPQGTVRVVVEVKRSFAPRDVGPVVRQARLLRRVAGDVPLLVLAPWLSERSRRGLAEAGIGYLDLTGNLRLVSNHPGLFIDRQSTAPPPTRPASSPSLKGVKAGRVVRLLADVRPPYGVIELAKHSGVTPGYMSRILEALDRDGLVERTPRGAITRVDWRELLERRAASYGLFTSNGIQRFVCPNGPAYALEVASELIGRGSPMTLTGSFAVERIVAVAPPSLLVLYAPTMPSALVENARLLPAEAGANVVIATPYDSVAMESRWPKQGRVSPGLPLASASQLVLDCLTGVGRMPQEAEGLLAWMDEDEGRWRLPNLAAAPEAAP